MKPAGVVGVCALLLLAAGGSGWWLLQVVASCRNAAAADGGNNERPAGTPVVNAKAGTLWQGTVLPQIQQQKRAPDFLVLDTGGSGGGFGQGDIRNNLHDIAFWDADHGWACGYGGVFRTADGGLSWTRVLPGGGWYQVELTGPEEIWLLEGKHPGGKGKVWLRNSTDGGQSWQEIAPGTFSHYWAMVCKPGQFWILGGGGGSWRSVDGEAWRREEFGGCGMQAYGIAIPGDYQGGEAVVYVVGTIQGKRTVLKSIDSGKSWQRLASLPESDSNFRHVIFFATSQLGWVGGEDGALWRTADGGASWQACPVPVKRAITALWFDSFGRGYAAVVNSKLNELQEALFSTIDGGAHWQECLNGAKQINRFFSLSPRQLWGAGNVPGYVPNDLILIRRPAE